MPKTSDHGARKRRTARDRTALWKRVGAFVKYERRLREQADEFETRAGAVRKPATRP
jgi:hypothetical protein